LRDCGDGYAGRGVEWVAIDSAADGRDGQTDSPDFTRSRQCGVVCGSELLGFAPTTAAPDRSYRVDHVTDAVTGEAAGPGNHGTPRGAASVSLAKLGHELGARGHVDRAVHATTARQLAVRGVDEGVGGEAGDVSTSKRKARDTAIGTNDLERS
jgi:hypothetical protein